MPTYPLISHPDTPPSGAPFKVWVNVDHVAAFGLNSTTNMVFGVGAPAARFVISESEGPRRADELWRSTCFEAFIGGADEAAYHEWNFAPSGDWASYAFEEYRAGRSDTEVVSPPYVRFEDNFTWWAVGATISIPVEPDLLLGLSAVIEEADGSKSYWALAHPPGKPDFHHPDCFAARLG